MIKIGGKQKTKKNENRGKFINFAEIGGVRNMHHWFRGWTPLNLASNPYYPHYMASHVSS